MRHLHKQELELFHVDSNFLVSMSVMTCPPRRHVIPDLVTRVLLAWTVKEHWPVYICCIGFDVLVFSKAVMYSCTVQLLYSCTVQLLLTDVYCSCNLYYNIFITCLRLVDVVKLNYLPEMFNIWESQSN